MSNPLVRACLAPLLCAALALPLPARAGPDTEDVLKVLGGLALIYVIGREVDRRGLLRPAPAPVPAPVPQASRAPVWAPLPAPPAPAPAPMSGDVRLLPEQCWTVVEGPIERRGGYDAGCLRASVARPAALPPRCERVVGAAGGTARVYDAGCLLAEGWQTRVARR